MLDKEKVREVANRYVTKVLREFAPNKIVLFGSYVNGTPHEWSDIDVAVLINDFDGNQIESASRLYHLTWDFDEAIEPHLLDPNDDPIGFVDHVIKTGEVIYAA